MIKISVIIPVYNVEKYLRQCLDSVINQTYKNLEIICIDDCSTDNSFQILKEYEKKDDRIIILQNEVNSKLGPTRNHGMKYATGEYIHFLDSDDWMELNAYEKLAQIIEKNGNIDVIEFCKTLCFQDSFVDCYFKRNDLIGQILNIKTCPDIFKVYNMNATTKIFNRNFIVQNKIIFNNYPYAEDVEWSRFILTKANSIYSLNNCLYFCRKFREGSLTLSGHLYCDYVVKSYINSYFYFSNIDPLIKYKFFNNEFYYLYKLLYEAFSLKSMSFTKLRSLIQELDEKILQKGFTSCNWYIYYKEILTQPEWLVVLKHKTRKFTQKNCPTLNKILVYLRKHIKLLGKI